MSYQPSSYPSQPHQQPPYVPGQQQPYQMPQMPPPAKTEAATTERIEVAGRNGEITFDGHYVTITRRRFLGRSTIGRGEKRIPVSAIAAVQWKPATALFAGFIQFETAGVGGTRSRFGRQTSDAGHDENSVVFQQRHMAGFERLREAVEQARASQQQPAAAGVADELAKLGALLQQGLLSPDEFTAAKRRLLGG